jgi:magnesium transporter
MYEIVEIKGDKVVQSEKEKLDSSLRDKNFVWINISAKSEKQLDGLADVFGFHRLALEDCVDGRQLPKIEIFDDYILVIVKDLQLNDNLVVNQLAMFIGKNYLVTVSNKKLDETEKVQENLTKWSTKNLTPDFLAYRLLDRITDSYFPILDGINSQIEQVEKKIIRNANDKSIPANLSRVRRQLLGLRKATWPARDVFSMLSKGELALISKKSHIFYRDVYDHVVLVIDLVETYRDLVGGVMEMYLSSLSNSINEVMKVLTVIATIFIPLTFITGLYGMNFRFMPEIGWEHGYWYSLVLMLIIGLGMVWYFKKKKWV